MARSACPARMSRLFGCSSSSMPRFVPTNLMGTLMIFFLSTLASACSGKMVITLLLIDSLNFLRSRGSKNLGSSSLPFFLRISW